MALSVEQRERLTACLHCGEGFVQSREGHVFCSSFCRHRGARRPDGVPSPDPDQVARLFDEGRDPDARVLPVDWNPSPVFAELDAGDTVGQRRRWYRESLRLGLLRGRVES